MTTTQQPSLDGVVAATPPNGDRPQLRRRRRRGHRIGLPIALVAVAAASVGGTLAVTGNDAEQEAGATRPETTTVQATRRTLVDSDTVAGTLGYDGARTIRAAAGGGGTVTALPSEGTTITRGKALYRVDDEPVTLLYGTVPLYRDLHEGVDDGTDVRQLEQNLDALGYDPGTVDKHFSSLTAAAVAAFQDDLGIEETGRATATRFAFLPGAIRVGTPEAVVGDRAEGALYGATGTTRVVTVDLDANDQELAVKDAKATITLPDGKTLTATVTNVGTVATGGSGEGEGDAGTDPTVPVTLTLDNPNEAGRLSSAPVTVALARTQKRDVVTVPVTALVALAEGGFAVRVPDAAAPSGSRLVGVQTGLYASGLVEITSGLAAGQSVVVPR
jgi:peptidoglycan hydrolase-like protein with peptidoglycan-binding domain